MGWEWGGMRRVGGRVGGDGGRAGLEVGWEGGPLGGLGVMGLY